MIKEIYKYPYNVRPEDDHKVFLSDVICEVVKVNYLLVLLYYSRCLWMQDARVNGKLEFNLLEDSNQQVILARNNSSSPTVRPGLVNGFSSHSRVNRTAKARGLKPERLALKAPRGFITIRPQTGARPE